MAIDRRTAIVSGLAAVLAAVTGCARGEQTATGASSAGGGTTSTSPTSSVAPATTARADADVVAFALGRWGCEFHDEPLTVDVEEGRFTLRDSGDRGFDGTWSLDGDTLTMEATTKGIGTSGTGRPGQEETYRLVIGGVTLDATMLEILEYTSSGDDETPTRNPTIKVSHTADSVTIDRTTIGRATCDRA